VPYLRLPFHWDELGQFVPATLDILNGGSWVPHSTDPNIHPPGVMAILAAVWSINGVSIISARLTMLAIAAIGVYFSFLLAIRLSRGAAGVPAFTAIAFLIAAPMFYTQSMMVLLDMPAMTLTALALLWFIEERYIVCAVATVALVLVKESAITTPFVFAVWLWFKGRRYKEALYFTAPAIALAVWLGLLSRVTGSIFGNSSFAQYNVTESIAPLHVLYAIFRRAYTLFFADGHWIGAIALYYSWRQLRGRDWTIAFWVATAQVFAVTIFGGAVLDRYLLPVLPILYAAFAVALSTFTPQRRMLASAALLVLLIVGWFVNPPYLFPLENNLSVVDFVHLQKDAAEYVESNYHDRRVASVWPFVAALRRPEMGYVQSRIRTVQAPGLHRDDFASMDLRDTDVIVTYARGPAPSPLMPAVVREWLGHKIDFHPEASAEELATLGYVSRERWRRGPLWIEIYTRKGY
jgi:hypothetical protein